MLFGVSKSSLSAGIQRFRGELISIALVPADEGIAPFYEAIVYPNPTLWVAMNVLPVLQIKPLSHTEVANRFAAYLLDDPEPLLVADWPEDIAHAARLLVTGPGQMKPIRGIRFELIDPSPLGFGESVAQHNAYQDAVVLRLKVLDHERRTGL